MTGGQFGDISQRLYKFNLKGKIQKEQIYIKRLAIKALFIRLKNGTKQEIV